MRNLIACPSPRDIEIVSEELKKIPCDKFFVKYHHENDAYRLIRDYFLEHREYDGYLIICPDDLIFTKKDYDILLTDVERLNPPAISGICNVTRDNAYWYSVSDAGNPEYYYMSWIDIKKLEEPPPIKKVTFVGFSATWIRRDIIEEKKVTFTGMPGGYEDRECGFDQRFAIELFKQNIPQYVDCRAKMLHLAAVGLAQENVGRKKPYYYLISMD